MYAALAEKILAKALDEQKMEYNGEFLLYLHLLEESGKYAQALSVVEALDDELHVPKIGYVDFKAKKRMLYLKKLADWAKLRAVCERHLGAASDANLDDWLCFLDYLEAIDASLLLELATEPRQKLVNESLHFLDGLRHRVKTTEDGQPLKQ